MNAKDGTLRKEQIYADARHPLKTAKDKTKGMKDIKQCISSPVIIVINFETQTITYDFALSDVKFTIGLYEREDGFYGPQSFRYKDNKYKNIDESQKDITRFIFSKNDILGKYDTICFTDGSNILELSEDILDMLDKSLLDKSEVAATKE